VNELQAAINHLQKSERLPSSSDKTFEYTASQAYSLAAVAKTLEDLVDAVKLLTQTVRNK